MTVRQAIEKAIVGGYGQKMCNSVWDSKGNKIAEIYGGFSDKAAFLDPLFWQSLGKTMGWREEYPKAGVRIGTFIEWKQMWHRFIDHLADGKDDESFFETL